MPDKNFNYLVSKKLEQKYQLAVNSLAERPDMTFDNPEYVAAAEKLTSIGRAIDDYEAENRVTDDQGKLLKPPATRTPAVFEPEGQKDFSWHFEPSIEEARAALKANPRLLQQLDPTGEYSRVASESGPTYAHFQDPMAPMGAAWREEQTWLDRLTPDNKLYKDYAEHAWKERLNKARSRYEGVKRYKNVPLAAEHASELISGGAQKAVHDIVAPAAASAANSMTGGIGAPYYDATRDLADYELSRMDPVDRKIASALGLDQRVIEDLPHYQDIENRNPAASIIGGFIGYGIKGNPTNTFQGAVANALKYGERDWMGKALAAGVAGGASNAAESITSDMARYANEGDAIPIGEAGMNIGINAALAGASGLATGGLFDLGGQGIQRLRQGFAEFDRNAPLRTLEQGGGSASIAWGASPPPEVADAFERARKNRFSTSAAPQTGAGLLASELAPEIERSVRTREVNNQDRIGRQMSEYYGHPDYRDIHGSAKPALEGLIELAQSGMGRSKGSGAPVPVNMPQLKRISNVLREYADPPQPMSNELAWADAAKTGGIVIPAELANKLFEGVIDPLHPGQSVVLNPIELNAQALTKMEERIYDELGISKTRGMNDDPVWTTVNKGIKQTRDQFPLYQDEAGELVGIPRESSTGPFDLADDIPRGPGRGTYLAPPIDVAGEPPPRPEGLMGIGGQNPIPENPFDPRLPVSRGLLDPAMAPNRQVSIEGQPAEPGYIPPEALPGVGPKYNPRDVGPALPIHGQLEVRGDHSQPPMVSKPDIPGAGPNYQPPDDPRRLGPALEGQAQVNPGGEYAQPPMVRQPDLQGVGPFRIMVIENGQPRPVAGMRMANSPEEAATMVDTLNSYGTDKFVAEPVEPTPPTPRGVGPEPAPVAGPPPVKKGPKTYEFPASMTYEQYKAMGGETGSKIPDDVQAKIDDGTLTTEAQQKELFLGKDKRGGLERSLDEQLERAPKVPSEEIAQDAALQTADREEVASNQKAYVEDIFAPGREARAAQVDKVRALSENPEVIEEAIAAVKKVDERLGPISIEQKREMVVKMIEQKLGRKIDVEDLIRFGLITAGLVQMGTSDDKEGGAAGAALFGLGFGRGKKSSAKPSAPATGPKKPTQPTYTLDNGEVVRGFSAMRAQQHEGSTAIEKAMKRLGVEGDATLEGRIRTYGQLNDRQKIDQALLDEANAIGKGDNLRRAAAANAYAELKDRAVPGGSLKGWGNAIIDFLGFRAYQAAEYPAGQFTRELERNPFVREPNTAVGKIQKALFEDPARRMLNFTRGGPVSRYAADGLIDALGLDEEERRRDQPSP